MGRDHEIVVARMQDQIPHGYRGQTVSPFDPVLTPIQRYVQARLGPREKQILYDRVLLEGVDHPLDVRSPGEPPPATAIVVGRKNERLPIPGAMGVESHVRRPGPENGGLDVGDPGAVGNGADSAPHTLPLPTSRSGHLDITFIRANPDHVSVDRTRSDDRDRGAARFFGAVHGLRVRSESAGVRSVPPVLASSCRIVCGQVTAYDLPGPTPIPAPVDELTPKIDAFGLMRIERDRRVPIKTKLGDVRRPGSNSFPLARSNVEANEVPARGNGVSTARLDGIDQDREAVIRPEFHPVTVSGATFRPPVRRPYPRPVALQASVDVEGDRHIDRCMVEPAERKPPERSPMLSGVPRHVGAMVRASIEQPRVSGMDPQDSKAWTGPAPPVQEAFSTVVAHGKARGEEIQPRPVHRIGHYVVRLIQSGHQMGTPPHRAPGAPSVG